MEILDERLHDVFRLFYNGLEFSKNLLEKLINILKLTFRKGPV